MMLGVDPNQLAQIQAVTKNLKAQIVVSRNKLELTVVTAAPDVVADQSVIQQLVDSLATSLAQQLSSFFAIQGELVRRRE